MLGRDCVGQCVGNEPPSTDSTVQAQTYDANGRLRYVKATTRRHFLTTDSVGTATTEYRYDALGRRVLTRYRGPIGCRYSGSSTACRNTLDHSVWDGNQLLSESREVDYGSTGSGTTGWDGDVVYTYGRELDVPLAMLRRSTTTSCTFRVFPRTDLLGRLAGGTFPSGTSSCAHVDWPAANMRTYRYLAGSVAAPWNGSLVTLNSDQSGLQYMRNRYFDPATGHFTQEHPIGLAGGMNLYGFAGGDPVNFSDPLGLSGCEKMEGKEKEECLRKQKESDERDAARVDQKRASTTRSCTELFLSSWADNASPFSFGPSTLVEPAAQAVGAAKVATAMSYAASRSNFLGSVGLVYPLKSLVFRSLVKAGQTTAEAAPLVGVVVAQLVALGTEMRALSKGECR